MRIPIIKLLLTTFLLSIYISVFSQDNFRSIKSIGSVLDSLKKNGVILGRKLNKPEISLSKSEALKYLQERVNPQFWHDTQNPLRQAFGRLIYEAAHPGYDSLRSALIAYPYDSLSIPWDKFYIWQPLRIKIPVFSKTGVVPAADSISKERNDSLKFSPRTVVIPPLISKMKDTTLMVIVDSLNKVSSTNKGFPFKYANNPFQGDSIQAAVNSLINFIDKRDSSLFRFTGVGKSSIPIMINSNSERFVRYWLKNEFSDSVAIWIGNPARNTIGLYLEQGINFRRPSRQGYSRPKINVQSIDKNTLLQFQNAGIKPKLWKYRSETNLVLNQTAMSNWVKGGDGSISTALDMTGYADYNNKALKMSSSNFARLKFGYLATGQDGITKNIDLLETNSKLNHLAFGKVDFSAILLFKTQIARGFNYFTTPAGKDTSSLVSKFMNPGVITVGLGFDYKPNKRTSINFSPLSYKGTFVTDPAYYNGKYDPTKIDQTQYGIPKDKKSLNEPGVSFMITNEFNPIETVDIINRLQLFTNYIRNPQDIDVDWEMIATAHLNWFTDVRFNTHLIYDDDTKTVEKDKHGKSILLPDGTEKKSARIQFKEMLGLSLSFKF